MGRLKKIERIGGWTEAEVRRILRKYAFAENSLKYCIENLYVFNWESDFLCCTKSGIYYEYEIKVSRSDFRADKKKKNKHLILEGVQEDRRPNYFYYAVPEGLIEAKDVPDYAGLVYIIDYFPFVKEIKPAPKLHQTKFTDEELGLLRKFYFNYRNWLELKEYEIEKLRKELNEAKTVEGKHYKYTLPQAIEQLEFKNQRCEEYKSRLQRDDNDIKELQRENRKLKQLLRDHAIDYSNILEE